MKKMIYLLLTVVMMLGMTACSGDSQKQESAESVETEITENEGITLKNSVLGEEYEFTYTEVPQKVVSLASPATEMLLALGLEDQIAGYAFQENVIPEKYQAAFDSLYQITDGWDLSLEQIVALEPDFMMFWNGSPDYTYEFLSSHGIGTYTMTSDIDGAKIESVYEDFTNMGKIFGVEERAAEIVAEMKAKIDPVKEAMKAKEPVSVAYIDAYSSEESAFTAGDALVADIFRTAGGENVIQNTTDPWLNVSWETIAAANPQWIVIGVYEGAEDADFWIDFLKTNPATSTMDAVVNENIIITGLVDLTVGERIADTVSLLAGYFHPEQ